MENNNQTKRSVISSRLRNLRNTKASPGLRIPQGVQAFTTVFLGLLTSFGLFAILSLAFSSQTAYAASYINVSSGPGGTVSLGSIKPSATGVSASGSDTLTVHTDCATGYSVYVSGQSDGDTNLTNTNKSVTSNNVISASSTSVGSTATALDANTWGINSENNNAYVGLPSYSSSATSALTTKSSVSEGSTVPIYYGVKVDTSLAPGTYSGDVLYTVVMDASCVPYVITFDKNTTDESITGEMENQSIMPGTSAKLAANAFSRDGYDFLGWSKTASGKTGTASDGIGTSDDIDYEDKEEVADLASGGGSVTLYAIWKQSADMSTMQGWATNSGCATLSEGESVTLTDTRDNKAYAVKKLPDGKCWMMQNLTIGSSGSTAEQRTLTKDNTNIDNGKTYYLPPAGKQGDIESSDTLTSSTAANFNNDPVVDKNAKTKFRNKSSYTNDSNTGYYNFYTATLGFSYYNGDEVVLGTSSRDICPKGWRLPRASDSDRLIPAITTANDFTYLARQYSSDWPSMNSAEVGYSTTNSDVINSMYKSAASPLATNAQNNYAGFYGAGQWMGGNSSVSNGGKGYYLTASVQQRSHAYNLLFESSRVYPQYYDSMYYGFAIRCIAQERYTIKYNAGNADSGTPSKISDGPIMSKNEASVVTPAVGGMIKDGYEFKGWALSDDASRATFQPEQTVLLVDILAAAIDVGQSATGGSTIMLYAVWGEPTITMQDWTGCSALSEGQSVYLKDARDDTEYAVKKLPDGKCWMMQNLTIGSSGSTAEQRTLTPDNTNIDNGKTYYLPPAGKQGDIESSDTLTSATEVNFSSSVSDNYAKNYSRIGIPDYDNDSSTSYYNFYTATLGFSYFNDNEKTSGTSTRDICPKGWRLPWVSDNGTAPNGSGDFATLARTYNPSASWSMGGTASDYSVSDTTIVNSMYTAAASPLSASEQNNNAGFSRAGVKYNTTSSPVAQLGYYVAYWSASVYDAEDGYALYAPGNFFYPQNNQDKYIGFAVRCIAKDTRTVSDITYMQDMNAEIVVNTAVGTSKKLIDYRDGKEYTVKKLPDGKLWMMQNLTIGSEGSTDEQRTLTMDNTNIDDGKTYYLPPAGKQGSIISSSTLTSSTRANFGSSGDANAKTLFSAKDSSNINDSDTGYYNFYTATLGYSWHGYSNVAGAGSSSSTRDICPKGWRLPWAGKDANSDSNGDFEILAKTYNPGASWTNLSYSPYYYYTNDNIIANAMSSSAAFPLATSVQNNNAGFSLSGYAQGNGIYRVSEGRYWSSTTGGSEYSSYLDVTGSSVVPRRSDAKYYGYAVRCVAK